MKRQPLQSIAHLKSLLKSISGFDEFETQQQSDRQREAARELADAKSLADKNIYFVDRFLAANLGDPKTPDLLALRQQLDDSRKRAVIEEITKANDSLHSYVSNNGLSDTYTHTIAEYTMPSVPSAGPPPTLDERLGITDKSRFVTHGPADEIDLLYNASPSAPSVWVNVRGDIVFQSDSATLCFAHTAPEATMLRYVERILAEQGAKRVVLGRMPCDLSKVGTSTDVIAFQRGELLKQHEEYLRALSALIRDNSFRQYRVITDYSSLAKRNETLSLQIESDVEKEAHEGSGVIVVSDSPAVCVVDAKASQVDGLEELLSRNRYLIAPSLNSAWTFVRTNADLAFLGLQRHQCGYVAADAIVLKTIMQALRRQQMQYRFGPVWFERSACGEHRSFPISLICRGGVRPLAERSLEVVSNSTAGVRRACEPRARRCGSERRPAKLADRRRSFLP